jgi:hypothetical protein
MRNILFIFLFTTIFVACSKQSRPPKVDHIEVDFSLIPFFKDFHSIHPDSLGNELERLKLEYGQFIDAYGAGVIGAGMSDEEGFLWKLASFLAYEPNQEVFDTCLYVFNDLDALKLEFEDAFRYYKYYFPEKSVPDVYMHISGFNQSILVDSSWVSVSVEKYLGRDKMFYEWLSIPVYLRRKMAPEKVVPDVMKALAMSEYLYNDSIDDVMNQMLYHGRLLYFVKQMVPFINDTLLFDYSPEQLGWVRNYEKTMWSTMVERKHLFSSERMTLQRYIGDTPFTFFFGQDSPGRTGQFIGYQIVNAYMRRNPEVTLGEMMKMENGHDLFRAAGYRP